MPARTLQRRRALRRGQYVLDRHFLRRKERYVAQAAFAAGALAVVLVIESSLSSFAIISAIASSAYIIFTVPHLRQSGPRRVLGGHAVAIVVGLIAAAVVHEGLGEPYEATLITEVAAAVTVGVGILVMAATDTEHAPAAGTILGLTFAPDPVGSGLLVIGAVAGLSAIRSLCKHWLIDLAH